MVNESAADFGRSKGHTPKLYIKPGATDTQATYVSFAASSGHNATILCASRSCQHRFGAQSKSNHR